MNAIEERVGVRFFDRLPSGYRATEAGETTMACAERIESEVHALGREILGQDMRVRGHVRVTAMEGLASLVLPCPLAELSRRHPGLSIEIVGTVAPLDLSRLVRVGGFFEHLTLDLWLLTHPDLRQTARVRVLMDFLYDVLLERRTLFEGPDAETP